MTVTHFKGANKFTALVAVLELLKLAKSRALVRVTVRRELQLVYLMAVASRREQFFYFQFLGLEYSLF